MPGIETGWLSDTESSGTLLRSTPPTVPSFTENLWQFRFGDFFPHTLVEGITIDSAPFSDIQSFSARHFESIYGRLATDSGWLWQTPHPSRKAFYEALVDCFVIRAEGQIVGVLVCHATDWSTYYLRNISILPTFQNRKLYQHILDLLLRLLSTTPAERLEIEVASVNHRAIHTLTKKGFTVTGTSVSERWGYMQKFTYLVNPQNRQSFENRFFVQTHFGARGTDITTAKKPS